MTSHVRRLLSDRGGRSRDSDSSVDDETPSDRERRRLKGFTLRNPRAPVLPPGRGVYGNLWTKCRLRFILIFPVRPWRPQHRGWQKKIDEKEKEVDAKYAKEVKAAQDKVAAEQQKLVDAQSIIFYECSK